MSDIQKQVMKWCTILCLCWWVIHRHVECACTRHTYHYCVCQLGTRITIYSTFFARPSAFYILYTLFPELCIMSLYYPNNYMNNVLSCPVMSCNFCFCLLLIVSGLPWIILSVSLLVWTKQSYWLKTLKVVVVIIMAGYCMEKENAKVVNTNNHSVSASIDNSTRRVPSC